MSYFSDNLNRQYEEAIQIENNHRRFINYLVQEFQMLPSEKDYENLEEERRIAEQLRQKILENNIPIPYQENENLFFENYFSQEAIGHVALNFTEIEERLINDKEQAFEKLKKQYEDNLFFRDTDRDGIPDRVDPEPLVHVLEKDTDYDGIPDYLDKHPTIYDKNDYERD